MKVQVNPNHKNTVRQLYTRPRIPHSQTKTEGGYEVFKGVHTRIKLAELLENTRSASDTVAFRLAAPPPPLILEESAMPAPPIPAPLDEPLI